MAGTKCLKINDAVVNPTLNSGATTTGICVSIVNPQTPSELDDSGVPTGNINCSVGILYSHSEEALDSLKQRLDWNTLPPQANFIITSAELDAPTGTTVLFYSKLQIWLLANGFSSVDVVPN